MNKTNIEYFKNRIEKAVKCTNGEISTRLNKTKISTGLSTEVKLSMIRLGQATLKPDYELSNSDKCYGLSAVDVVCRSFVYPLTPRQEDAIRRNKCIDNKIEGLHTEVELEGSRLLDRMVLGVVTDEQVPDELKAIGDMVNLAVA